MEDQVLVMFGIIRKGRRKESGNRSALCKAVNENRIKIGMGH